MEVIVVTNKSQEELYKMYPDMNGVPTFTFEEYITKMNLKKEHIQYIMNMFAASDKILSVLMPGRNDEDVRVIRPKKLVA